MAANFITANETNRRLSDQHATMRDEAVEEINKIIREAKELPIAVPKGLFTDTECVRAELLRKLRDESGWKVLGDYDESSLPTKDCVYLTHPTYRKESAK